MRRRPIALAAILAATAAVLAACDKPVPEVTLQSGSNSTTVRAQTYCFDLAHCRIRTSGGVGSLHAQAGSTILVDVPRDVAGRSWSAVSAQLESNGAFKTLPGAQFSTGTQHHTHAARVSVPYGAGSTYYLVVIAQSGGKQTGSWVSRITITS
jgi:hypothetical protein